MSDLGLSIDYDRVMKIETEIASSVTDIINKSNGVYVPHTTLSDKAIHFAINKTDCHNDMPDGKGEFHGTGQILFQKVDSKAKTLEKFKITRSNKTTRKCQYNPFIYSIPCDTPSPPAEFFPDFNGTYECDQLQLYKNMDQTWAICHVRI